MLLSGRLLNVPIRGAFQSYLGTIPVRIQLHVRIFTYHFSVLPQCNIVVNLGFRLRTVLL